MPYITYPRTDGYGMTEKSFISAQKFINKEGAVSEVISSGFYEIENYVPAVDDMGEERELANELLDFNDEIEKLINEALNYTLKQMLGLEFSANDADRMRDISERMRNIAGNEKHRDSIRKMSLSDNASSWQKNMAMRAWNNLNQAGKLAGDLDKIRNKTMEEIL